jgi:hypothetical protein
MFAMQGLIIDPNTHEEIIVSGRQDMLMQVSRFLERQSPYDKPCIIFIGN